MAAAAAALMVAWTTGIPAQATLTGKWQGETPNGAVLVLELEEKGTALSGTLARNGVSTTLSEGKVSKNRFTFKATLNEETEGFSGELSDNQIKIWLDRQGAEAAIVLKRVKSESPL
jgi:hypothetical protein